MPSSGKSCWTTNWRAGRGRRANVVVPGRGARSLSRVLSQAVGPGRGARPTCQAVGRGRGAEFVRLAGPGCSVTPGAPRSCEATRTHRPLRGHGLALCPGAMSRTRWRATAPCTRATHCAIATVAAPADRWCRSQECAQHQPPFAVIRAGLTGRAGHGGCDSPCVIIAADGPRCHCPRTPRDGNLTVHRRRGTAI